MRAGRWRRLTGWDRIVCDLLPQRGICQGSKTYPKGHVFFIKHFMLINLWGRGIISPIGRANIGNV